MLGMEVIWGSFLDDLGAILQSFQNHFGAFSGSGCQLGLERVARKIGSKHMCFIDQSGRDPPFRLDETHVRVTKYCVLSIRMDGAPGGKPLRSRN